MKFMVTENGMAFTIEASSLSEALEKAKEDVDTSNYDVDETVFVHVTVSDGDRYLSGMVTLDPEIPDCDCSAHKWVAPYHIVGGDTLNPGVWGNGGGAIIKELCNHCGLGRITDTWAQGPNGVRGYTSTKYLPHASTLWAFTY
jgi:hypothetical protein